MNLETKLERIKAELEENIKQKENNPFNVEQELKYFCKIHNRIESAKYIGTMGHIPLYNTPDGFTFSYETIKMLVNDKCDQDWWEQYKK